MTTALRVIVFLVGLRVVVSIFTVRRSNAMPSSRLERLGKSVPGAGLIGNTVELQKQLEALRVLCGRSDAMTAERAAGMTLVMLGAALALATLALLGNGIWMLPIAVCAIVCSPGVVRVMVCSRAGQARRAAQREVGPAMDLLASWLGSGISMEAGIRKLAVCGPATLRMTFRAVAGMMDGGLPIHRALSSAARMSGLDSLATCAARIERNRDLGLPTSDLLHDMAASLRAEAHAAAKQRAGRRGPLATLVTAMVIAPACVAFLATLLVAGMADQGLGR
jgi:Flp pilus assembly protein TadB